MYATAPFLQCIFVTFGQVPVHAQLFLKESVQALRSMIEYATAPFLHYIFVTFGQLLPPPRGIHQLNLGIQPRRRRRVRVPARLHKPRQNASRQQQVVAAHHRVGTGTPACFSQLYSSSLFATAVSVHRSSMESSALQRASRVCEILHRRSVHWRRF